MSEKVFREEPRTQFLTFSKTTMLSFPDLWMSFGLSKIKMAMDTLTRRKQLNIWIRLRKLFKKTEHLTMINSNLMSFLKNLTKTTMGT